MLLKLNRLRYTREGVEQTRDILVNTDMIKYFETSNIQGRCCIVFVDGSDLTVKQDVDTIAQLMGSWKSGAS